MAPFALRFGRTTPWTKPEQLYFSVFKMAGFSLIKGYWAIVKLDATQSIPDWALNGSDFVSITRTPDELSIVCPDELVPEGCQHEAGWALLKLHGPFALDQIGVLSSVAAPLADAGVSIFTISTFDTDYILVKAAQLSSACEALVAAGHVLE
jgi:hypothetical protein